jgi:hypothetical protein
MKKLLSALVACALTLALLAPAGAAINPDYLPTFTQQPPKSLYVAAGEEFTLEIKAEPPKAGGTMTYQWYSISYPPLEGSVVAIEGATGPKLTLTAQLPPDGSAGLSWAGNVFKTENYWCQVTTAFDDGASTQAQSRFTLVRTYYDLAGAGAYLAAQWDQGALFFLRALADFAFIPVLLGYEGWSALSRSFLAWVYPPGMDAAPA